MKKFILLFIALAVNTLFSAAQTKEYAEAFNKLNNAPAKLAFSDNFEKSWKKNWHLDGKVARIIQKDNSISMYAGEKVYNEDKSLANENHLVLWTKKEFEGDIKIEYDFTRLDTSKYYWVNILYIQAQGSGEGKYKKDIFKWNKLREIPAMHTYFDNMNTYHISYAVQPVPSEGKREYIRARRYMPEWKKLKGTNLMPEYFDSGLFKKDVRYHITCIKKGTDIYFNVQGDNRNETFYFSGEGFPPIEKGRIGLRQMFTRHSKYENFKVYTLQ